MRRRPRSSCRAFTLIELLVVIAIIGGLMAIVMPSLGKARANSKRTVCASNLRQVGTGLRSYLDSNADIFPDASFLPSVGPGPLTGPNPVYIADVLSPHLGGALEVFHCPNDTEGAVYDANDPSPRSTPYFETEKSSYEYRYRFGGRTMKQFIERMAQHTGTLYHENTIWLMRDYDNFHATAGMSGSRRYLYYDNHVTDFENN